MKRTLVIVISLFAMASSAIAQRIPDSSVTGSARATVGINPAALTPGGDSGIQNAYDPSWTMLVGSPTQTLLPKRFSIHDLSFTFEEGGTVRIDTATAEYSCVSEPNPYNEGTRDRCTFIRMRPVAYTMSPAPGRGSTRLSFSYAAYTGQEYFAGDYFTGAYIYRYQVTLNPVINALGALTGYSFQTADDDWYYGTYNNADLKPFSGPITLPAYFCDPQNACGYIRSSWTVNK